MSIVEVRPVAMPSRKELASYYCAQYFGPAVCRAFGPVSSISDARFAFDVELELFNPNRVPLPVVESLFAFTAGREQGGVSKLGTVCLRFCEDPNRCRPEADACRSDTSEIRDVGDFANAATDYLFALTVGNRRIGDLRIHTIPPNGRTRMVVRLGLDPKQTAALIGRLADDEIARMAQGRLPELSIPYAIEGTAWISIESFGRLAVGFGPRKGQWPIR